MTAARSIGAGHRYDLLSVEDAAGARRFRAVLDSVYQHDPNWVPPLPGAERDSFNPQTNPSFRRVQARRWVLMKRGLPVGRIAAFAPAHRPGVGYFGFFESPPDPSAGRMLLNTAADWLATEGRRECYGPIAITPRDRIGLLVEGFDRPAMLFTPYNPPYYPAMLEAVGWLPHRFLHAYGWDPRVTGHGSLPLPTRAGVSPIRIRSLRIARLREETALIARLINETLAHAWHFEPISQPEADQMARMLRPILDPTIALVAEDDEGPCGVALGLPDVNWLWHRAGGTLWPLGWARLLRWRHHIPQVRLMVLGLTRRAQRTGLVVRMIHTLHRAGLARGYVRGELSQVYDDNVDMSRILDRMGFPVVRRYAVYHRSLDH